MSRLIPFIQHVTLAVALMFPITGGSALAAEPKVGADLKLRNGQEVRLTEVFNLTSESKDHVLTLLWGSFELDIQLAAVQQFDLSKTVTKESYDTFTADARVMLRNGTELKGLAKIPHSGSLTGTWELGTRSVKLKDVASGSFQGPVASLREDATPLGTLTDRTGKSITFRAMSLTYGNHSDVAEAIFGDFYNITRNYLGWPLAYGYVFLPMSDIDKIIAKEAKWEIEMRSGEKFSLKRVKETPVLSDETVSGRFRLKPDDLNFIKVDNAALAPMKPTSGAASKESTQPSGVLSDLSSFTYKLENIGSYFTSCGSSFGMYGCSSVATEAIDVTFPDGTTASVELAKLSSILFKDSSVSLTGKSGRTVPGNLAGPGFIGRVTIGRGNYWGYFPLNSIKSIQFE